VDELRKWDSIVGIFSRKGTGSANKASKKRKRPGKHDHSSMTGDGAQKGRQTYQRKSQLLTTKHQKARECLQRKRGGASDKKKARSVEVTRIRGGKIRPGSKEVYRGKRAPQK